MFPVINVASFRLGQASYSLIPPEQMPNPDSFPPEKVEPEVVSTAEGDAARAAYMKSANALEGLSGWKIPISTWRETATQVQNHAYNEYLYLVNNARGKTGNPDAEIELERKWWALWQRAVNNYWHPPSAWEVVKDIVGTYVSDFLQGAQKAWQDYSQWAIEHMGPALEMYYNSVNSIVDLQTDLSQATASGKFSKEELDAQAVKIANAIAARNAVINAYAFVSAGGSIDQVAQERFGQFKLGMAGWIVPAISAVIVAGVIAALVVVVAEALGNVFGKLAEIPGAIANFVKDHPAAAISIGAVLLAVSAMFLVPMLFGKKEEIQQVPAERIPA